MAGSILDAPLAPPRLSLGELDPDFVRLLKSPGVDRDFHRLLQGSVKFDGGGGARVGGKWVGKIRGASRVGGKLAMRALSVIGFAADIVQTVAGEYDLYEFEQMLQAMGKQGELHIEAGVWAEWAAQFDPEEVEKEMIRIRRYQAQILALGSRFSGIASNIRTESLKSTKTKRVRRMTHRRG